jgi:Protein of unknown function (DUF1638)
MRLKLISCEVLYREMCDSVARSPHQVDVEFLPKGLHDMGSGEMRRRLQEVIDRTDPSSYEAVLMGYALCGTGLAGLIARTIPIVVPRAHDCIALLMGSRRRYQEYFDAHPGVYFRSTGWLERGESLEQIAQTRIGVGKSLDELIQKYGDENGRYLYEELNRYQQNYRQLTYIETRLEPNDSFEQRARQEAVRRGWEFEKIAGDLTLFRRLISGDWGKEDFLTVDPGFRIIVRYDDDIIDVERCPS